MENIIPHYKSDAHLVNTSVEGTPFSYKGPKGFLHNKTESQ